jgi:hypothetical protein
MSYTKVDNVLSNLSDALAAVAPENATSACQDALLASGVTVALEDGTLVWAACVSQDNPDTPFVELLTVALAGDANGSVRLRDNGMPVHRVFWHSVDPVVIADRGMDAIRRDLLLLALGEEPDDTFAMPNAAERSIRTVISVADQMAAPQGDVL